MLASKTLVCRCNNRGKGQRYHIVHFILRKIMAARRKRLTRGHASRRPGGEDSSSRMTYRTIVYVTIAFCVVAILGLASHPSNWATDSSSLDYRSTKSVPIFYSTNNISDSLLLRLDAIVILGGGRPQAVDEPPIYVQKRCDDAAELAKRYQALQQKVDNKKSSSSFSLPILCLSAGTAHVPQLLDAGGLPVWESTASAAYLAKVHGIRNDSLYVETTSYDTIGNAYYARTSHTDVNGWRNLLVSEHSYSSCFMMFCVGVLSPFFSFLIFLFPRVSLAMIIRQHS